jgi:hypothetical protein
MVSSSSGTGGIVIGRPVVQSKKEKEKEAAAKQQGMYILSIYHNTHILRYVQYYRCMCILACMLCIYAVVYACLYMIDYTQYTCCVLVLPTPYTTYSCIWAPPSVLYSNAITLTV